MREYKPTKFVSAMLHSDSVIVPEHKICKQCKEDKDISDFSRAERNGDGYNTVCKKCRSANSLGTINKKNEEKKFWSQFSPI